jgi:hypothetical protein
MSLLDGPPSDRIVIDRIPGDPREPRVGAGAEEVGGLLPRVPPGSPSALLAV